MRCRRCARVDAGSRRGASRPAAGSSESDSITRPVSIRPPRERRCAASASASRWEPPAATGQPTACAPTARTMPKAALAGVESESIECAQHPASRARARSPSKRERARPTAERRPLRPKRPSRRGWRGGRSGPRSSRTRESALRTRGSNSRRYAPRVGSEGGRRLLHRALQDHRRPAVERMRQRSLGVHELQTVLGQRQPAQERRQQRQGVDGRAGVVDEARQGQLLRSRPAADGLRRPRSG